MYLSNEYYKILIENIINYIDIYKFFFISVKNIYNNIYDLNYL